MENEMYMALGLLFLAIVFLTIMVWNLKKRLAVVLDQAVMESKLHTNNKVAALDRVVPKFRIDEKGEVKLMTPDGKEPIHFWQLNRKNRP